MFSALLDIVNSGVIDNPSSENDMNVIIKPMSQIDMNSFWLGTTIGLISGIFLTIIALIVINIIRENRQHMEHMNVK